MLGDVYLLGVQPSLCYDPLTILGSGKCPQSRLFMTDHQDRSHSPVMIPKVCLVEKSVSKNRGKTPKMDGENNGNPYFLMDDSGGNTHYFRKHPYVFPRKKNKKKRGKFGPLKFPVQKKWLTHLVLLHRSSRFFTGLLLMAGISARFQIPTVWMWFYCK